jgi:glycosyltransferase involved in cell wall biosynthesis
MQKKRKIIVASSAMPFVQGGAHLMVDWLTRTLIDHGHQVETLELPFSPRWEDWLEQMLAFRLIDLSQHGDLLIAIRPPSYLLRHPNKVLWFIHHLRSAYDLWGTRYQDLPYSPEGLRHREAVMRADGVALAEAKKVYCNSHVVAQRLAKFNQIQAEVLYPPLFRPERFRSGPMGDYLLYVSRLTHHKRQWLAIEAMRYAQTPVKLIIAGKPEPGEEAYAAELRSLIERYHLERRVTLLDRWIAEEEKITLLAECLAAIYLPLDEDSYGYASLEAHHAGKAIVTTADSGGTLELVQHGVNGVVTDPDPEALAAAIDELYRDRSLAERMGQAGQKRIAELGISWDRVIARLLV